MTVSIIKYQIFNKNKIYLYISFEKYLIVDEIWKDDKKEGLEYLRSKTFVYIMHNWMLSI